MAQPRPSTDTPSITTDGPSRSRSFLLLAAGTWCTSVGLSIQNTIGVNFMVERLGLGAQDLGIVRSIIEIPGLCSVFIAAAVMRIAERTVGMSALLLLAVGMAALSRTTTFVPFVIFYLIAFAGIRLWVPVARGMSLAVAETGTQGAVLGRLGAIGATGFLAGAAVVYLASERLGFPAMYLLAGATFCAGALAVRMIDRRVGHETEARLVFRRRYVRYYAIMFLDGFRLVLIVAFARFALVKVYGASVGHIAVLGMITTALIFLTASRVGRWVDRYGPRRVLVGSYLTAAAIFLGYAVSHDLWLLSALLVPGGALWQFSNVAITAYAERAVSPPDLRPTLAAGETVGRAGAVLLALGGGLVWEAFGYPTLFAVGMVVTLLLVAVSARISVTPTTSAAASPL